MLTDIWSAMWAFATEQHILSVNQNVSFLSSLSLFLSLSLAFALMYFHTNKGKHTKLSQCDDFSFFSAN